MKNLLKIFTYSLLILTFSLGTFSVVSAQSSVSVEFEKTPLFSEANFLPQDSVTRFVKMTNNTDNPVGVSVRATNVSDNGFGDYINLKIKRGDILFFDGTFKEFFNKSSVALPQLPVEGQVSVDFIATFLPTDDNDSQNESISFNLQLIFEGGEVVNDITISFGGGISSGGGGGGGNGPIIGAKNLIISDELINAINPPESNSVLVTWKTNIPATSQVIYGLASDGPYNLNLSLPNYGYPLSTTEDLNKVSDHSVVISNLIPLQVYSMRVVSRASPPTIGYEYLFSVDEKGQVYSLGNINGTLIAKNGQDEVKRVEVSDSVYSDPIEILETITNEQNNSTTTVNNNINNQVANVVFAGSSFLNKTGLWIFGIILLLFLFIFFFRRRNKEEEDK